MSAKKETKVELKTISEINEPCFEFTVKTTPPISFCSTGLFFMSLAHEFGNIKYKKYSWINDPEGSSSLPEDSLNAIFRHVTLMQMGFKYDSETKFFHLGHALARTQSLVSNTYRKILTKTDKKFDKASEPLSETNQPIIDPDYPREEDPDWKLKHFRKLEKILKEEGLLD